MQKSQFYKKLEALCSSIEVYNNISCKPITVELQSCIVQSQDMDGKSFTSQKDVGFTFFTSEDSLASNWLCRNKMLTRDEIISKILKGETVSESQMYRTVKGYTPTGCPKDLPLTKKILVKYAKYLQERGELMPDLKEGVNTNRVITTNQYAQAHH